MSSIAVTLLGSAMATVSVRPSRLRSEEHTSELQSQSNLVCRLLLEKKKTHTSPCRRRGHWMKDCARHCMCFDLSQRRRRCSSTTSCQHGCDHHSSGPTTIYTTPSR